jgi:hypothetical protein
MMRTNDQRLVHSFFHDRLGLHWSEDFRGALYVPEEYRFERSSMDHVAIAVGYNNFIGKTCCIHTVIQRPDLLTRKIIREAFEYPFIVCGLEALLGLVDSTNDDALRFDTKLGFKEVYRVPGGGTDGDLIVMQMLRGECRWLRKDH